MMPSSADVMSLTSVEAATLASFEAVIKQGLDSFVEVGNALAAIRDSRLYRDEFATFEEYCREKWSFSKQYAHRLMNASEIVQSLPESSPGATPTSEKQVRHLAQVPKEERAAVWQEAVDTAPKDSSGKPKLTAAHVEATVAKALDKPAPHVANNSGNNEWYTPPHVIDAAVRVLGEIDCDQASSTKANEVVRARRIYTATDCGLAAKRWGKRVWMNPPYAQPLCSQFCESLISRLDSGDVAEAVVLVNNATETEWFRTLAGRAVAACFLAGRVRFLDHNGEPKNTPLQGQAVLYFGHRATEFVKEFSVIGWGVYVA
jgi:hypothetical protein